MVNLKNARATLMFKVDDEVTTPLHESIPRPVMRMLLEFMKVSVLVYHNYLLRQPVVVAEAGKPSPDNPVCVCV